MSLDIRYAQLDDYPLISGTSGSNFKLREVLSMKNVGDLIDLIHAKQGVPA